MPFIVDGNEYLSQGSAVDTAAVDEVNRNPGYVPGRRNGLMKDHWLLGANRL